MFGYRIVWIYRNIELSMYHIGRVSLSIGYRLQVNARKLRMYHTSDRQIIYKSFPQFVV